MKKRYLLLIAVMLMSLCLVGCEKYKESEIIGLNSSEIIEKYGEFDRPQGEPDEDGLYRKCSCGYLVAEKRVGFLGSTPPEYFMIDFDENGLATSCRYEQVV